MKLLFSLPALSALLLFQNYAPPPVQPPEAAKVKEIVARADKLRQRLELLRRHGLRDAQLVEIEVFLQAADRVMRLNEFYQKEAADWALQVLDAGLLRASQAAQGEVPWWQETGHTVVRAYRSVIDGSAQPYAVTLPATYGKDPAKKWRVDVVLHGRDNALTEVKFLHEHRGDREPPKDREFIQLDIFGRGNNAYRWAGEVDVVEAHETFFAVERLLGRGQLLDPARQVLRGFSMGGAGTWSLGLHEPDRWCVLGPGAGFTATHGYVKDLPNPLPPYQEACLRIYDAVHYAENVANVPVVAYAGANDPQIQAARNIEARLKPLGIPMTLLVAPELEHKFPPEWQKKAEEEYAKPAAKGREEYPKHIHFVTYTMRYAHCDWVTILGLDRHYERTLVDATAGDDGFAVKTANVRALSLDLPHGSSLEPVTLTIDGQKLQARPTLNTATGTIHLYLERRDGRWSAVLPERLLTDFVRRPQKVTGLQGPIDDAFGGAFLCVAGTGEPWNPAVGRYAEESLKRFQAEWDRYFRGELAVKRDIEVTADDIATKHLVLFGDPGSNTLIAQVLDRLPLQWTKERLVVNDTIYRAADHVPLLIYPSPLNARRYVVLNSGHTFHAKDFEGTNALLYPRLGDYAVLTTAGEVETAGLFDEFWK